jgi:class 3 adenylate cyclase
VSSRLPCKGTFDVLASGEAGPGAGKNRRTKEVNKICYVLLEFKGPASLLALKELFLEYKPAPIDTSKIILQPEISELTELLARNTHDNWGKLRMAEGWRFGSAQNDIRREHPDLVPYDRLPESEKEYDRRTAIETIKALLAMGYTIQSPASTRNAAKPASIPDSDSGAQLVTQSGGMDIVSLERLWRGHNPETWSKNPEAYQRLAERSLRLGEPLLAYDILAEAIKILPKDLRLRQLLALALARSGAAGAANVILTELYDEGHRDEETLGLLARTHKDLAAESDDDSVATQHLRRASEFYTIGYELTGGYWSGINAATLALFLGEKNRAANLARQVQEHCRKQLDVVDDGNPERYWLVSTLGEAALVQGDWSTAEEWYCKAAEIGCGQWGNLRSTRHNANLLAQHWGRDRDDIERLFRFPCVIVFTGHMIDRPGRKTPRFPQQIEEAVKKAIRERLQKLNAGFAYGSAACGSDILLHEAMLEARGETHVVLPYERELFVRNCVDLEPDGNWARRFEKIVAQSAGLHEISTHCETHSVSYDFANQILHGLANMRAKQLETKFVPLAVWDGRPGQGPGGTGSAVQRWREHGLEVEVIDLAEILSRECPNLSAVTTPPQLLQGRANKGENDFVSEIRALLFADAEGFSKLTDAEITRFVQHFLGLVGDLLKQAAHKPLMKNTWGDGLYFVFSGVREAGQFALDLRDRVQGTNWQGKGLPKLNIRIGLHAGPVFFCTDPVTERTNFIGMHVSRAARIEPVTPPGQVYASQSFAALAAAEGVEEFRCDYVGQTPMAKKYGVFPTYAVLRGTGLKT